MGRVGACVCVCMSVCYPTPSLHITLVEYTVGPQQNRKMVKETNKKTPEVDSLKKLGSLLAGEAKLVL